MEGRPFLRTTKGEGRFYLLRRVFLVPSNDCSTVMFLWYLKQAHGHDGFTSKQGVWLKTQTSISQSFYPL